MTPTGSNSKAQGQRLCRATLGSRIAKKTAKTSKRFFIAANRAGYHQKKSAMDRFESIAELFENANLKNQKFENCDLFFNSGWKASAFDCCDRIGFFKFSRIDRTGC